MRDSRMEIPGQTRDDVERVRNDVFKEYLSEKDFLVGLMAFKGFSDVGEGGWFGGEKGISANAACLPFDCRTSRTWRRKRRRIQIR